MSSGKHQSNSSIRLRLREVREAQGLDQGQLATRAGVKQALLSHIERAVRLPSLETLVQLADALDVSVDHLLCRTQVPKVKDPAMEALVRTASRLREDDVRFLVTVAKHLDER